jgi:hypothetical protein
MSIPDSTFAEGDCVPVRLAIRNGGKESIFIEDTSLSPKLKNPIYSNHTIRFESMFSDIRPEYGMRRLIAVPSGAEMVTMLSIETRILPKDSTHRSKTYEVEAWIGYMNSDTILLPLLNRSNETFYPSPKEFARLTELHRNTRLGPLRVTVIAR